MTVVTEKVELGQVLATPDALDKFGPRCLRLCLDRHRDGDFGDLCDEDLRANAQALIDGTRLLSNYDLDAGKLWIITEWDRSVTTCLLPENY